MDAKYWSLRLQFCEKQGGQIWLMKFGNELKVVYTGQPLDQYYNSDFELYYLQPCSMKNVQETIEQVKKHPKWKLSYQQQKVLNIR